MSVLAIILLIAGALISLGAGLWLLVLAFQEGIWWGLGSLLLSPVMLVFVILHWSVAKRPFLINLGGAALMIVGVLIGQAQGPATTGY
ncbi:hypothetical protein ACI2IY_23540 [Lysobacter enzymogenes]|uniref:hypothetical protein n=1 Tax=Lysobacter enzymogenes TaxID=69 RepID=UPI00384DA35B